MQVKLTKPLRHPEGIANDSPELWSLLLNMAWYRMARDLETAAINPFSDLQLRVANME